jgi:hypothetical protein
MLTSALSLAYTYVSSLGRWVSGLALPLGGLTAAAASGAGGGVSSSLNHLARYLSSRQGCCFRCLLQAHVTGTDFHQSAAQSSAT